MRLQWSVEEPLEQIPVRMVSPDCHHGQGLQNRGSFARGFTSKGVHLRQEHGGIIRNTIKAAIKYHHVTRKDQMKQCASLPQIVKNDSMRKGGFSPSQWVSAKAPRRPGLLAEEAGESAKGICSSVRAVKHRKAKPLDKQWSVGDLIHQNARSPGEEWSGAARIIGFDRIVVWLLHGAVPVTSAVHVLRPASTASMLALQVMSRLMVPTD